MEDLSVDPDYAGLIGAANRDVDRVMAAVEVAARDENILTARAVPVSAIAVLSMAGPMYLAQHVNVVDHRLARRDSSMGKWQKRG